MTLIFAERFEGSFPVEEGVFMSIEEFAAYRAEGWRGTDAVNKLADEILARRIEGTNGMPIGDLDRVSDLDGAPEPP